MVNEGAARRYAAAAFDLARDRQAIDRTGKDLQAVRDAVYSDPDTKEFFLSPVVDRKQKERVLADAFSGKVDEIALHLALLLVRKRRESLLAEIVRQYGVLQMRSRGAEPLTITSARLLTAEQLSQVVTRLEKVYGKKFDVEQRVDPNLIGGIRIMMGDRRIDGSVEGRLEQLARTLFAHA